jgi:N-acetylmuramoyl-L-alanine amidase
MKIVSVALIVTIFATTGGYLQAPTSNTLSPGDEEHCLALNIYHEARGEDYLSQLAVADVTMNRVKNSKFPNSVCEVITQAYTRVNWRGDVVPIKHKCQFSWYCDGVGDKYRGITQGALFYHSNKVLPFWADSFIKLGSIGNHIFYIPPNEK